MRIDISKKVKLSIVIIIIISLFIPTVLPTSPNQQLNNNKIIQTEMQEPELILEKISGGLGVSATIKNIGGEAARNITWSIDLDGSYILVGGSTGCPTLIPSIEPNQTLQINSRDDKFIFGFGKTNIDITVNVEGQISISETVTGFALGFIILVNE